MQLAACKYNTNGEVVNKYLYSEIPPPQRACSRRLTTPITSGDGLPGSMITMTWIRTFSGWSCDTTIPRSYPPAWEHAPCTAGISPASNGKAAAIRSRPMPMRMKMCTYRRRGTRSEIRSVTWPGCRASLRISIP